jgi:small subunit ribosomal protein S3
MGQKTNPIGLRIAVTKDWRSKWYADKKEFGTLLTEDRRIRAVLKQKLESASVPKILIERAATHHDLHGPAGGCDRAQGRGDRQVEGRAEQADRQGDLRGHPGDQTT